MSGTSNKNDPVASSIPPTTPAGEVPDADARPLESTSCPAALNDRWLVRGVCIVLAAMVWVVFGQTLHHEFINYDDNYYVYENPAVTRGLNLKGVEWVFTHSVSANWHPLTMMSHMLDCQIYGLKAGGHHLTSVLLHTASVILLFLVLRQMTGFLWRSAFVAAVFAIHPLRVESVAWVAERKDVLSGLFFMLTLWAYVRYVPKQSRVEGRASSAGGGSLALDAGRWTLDYFLVLLFFTMGLMCKPMLVTLPLVLLLLDYWPLGRVAGFHFVPVRQANDECQVTGGKLSTLNFQLSALLLEKLPLFGLAVASCVVTIFAQAQAIMPIERMSLPLRVGNASISCVTYLGQMFWPSGLAVLYPFTAGRVGVLGVVLSLVLLACISTGAYFLRRRRPYFLTGWLWYLIMLVPVIGIVQVGIQARADRYTYLPQIGLYLLLTWALADLCAGWRHRRRVLGGLATVILAALMFCARVQTSYWRDNESLWTHTLACTSGNAEAHVDLGNALLHKERVDEAIAQYQKGLEINPCYVEARNNLGNALLEKNRVDEAIIQYQKALEIKPGYVEAHINLGNARFQKGSEDEAIIQYQEALKIKPDSAEAHYDLGNVLFQQGKVDEAITHLKKALEIKSDYREACNNFGIALLKKGRVDEAIAQYQNALQIKPDYAEARNNLDNALFLRGREVEVIAQCQKALQINPDSAEALNKLAWLLATCPDVRIRDGAQAIKYAGHACELTHYSETIVVGTLAAAYAEAGRYDDAVAMAQNACALATAAGEQTLLGKNRQLLALYRARQPYHETAEIFVSTGP